LKGYISFHILICTRYLPTHGNDRPVKEEKKERGERETKKERSLLPKTGKKKKKERRPEIRRSKIEFQRQPAFLPSVGSLGWK
jgi:hypothetical protein